MRATLFALLLWGFWGRVTAALPPIIDRNALFGEIQIENAEISPDGKYLAFLRPYKGARNIWIKKVDEPFAAARPVSAETQRPIPGYFWSRDGKYILYVQDQGGDENFNVYAIDPAAAPAASADVPMARNISDAKGARTEIYALPKNQPDILYIGLNDRDKAWHDLYRLRISSGEKTLIRTNTDRIAAWIFDHSGDLRLAQRTTDKGDTELLRVDADGFTPIYSCSVLEVCDASEFNHANDRVYLITNKGTDLVGLDLLDPATGAVSAVESDPKRRVDLEKPLFSELKETLVATVYVEDRQRVYWRDQSLAADYQWLQRRLPGRELSFASHSRDENLWIVQARSDTEPGEAYLFNRSAKILVLQFRIREDVPRAALAPMHSIHYRSIDGLDIPAYLTLPKGVPAKALPLMVFPHGGPWARDRWGYQGFPQFFANRGYAVLQPNFRGSTGYGKAFLNAGNGQWGRKMQDDLSAGVKYLVAQGIVDPKRVGIAGGSYGGYAALAGVAFTPQLYAAAVSIVGPSNLITLLHSIPPYWEAGRRIMYTRMADPGTPDGRALLEAESPLNAANNIATPLLVVQGANDPRVNKRESDQIVVALRDRKVPVDYLVAPDEGHGFARPINNLAMIAEIEEFLAAQLHGRIQADVPEDVAARLKEITVDPASVVLPATADSGATLH
jgi:dipeptidyl aminopeptidase/acylaminoacyl peptidase